MAFGLSILVLDETFNLLFEKQEEQLDEFYLSSVAVYRLKSGQLDPFANLIAILSEGSISGRANRTLLILHDVTRLGRPAVVTSCTSAS